MPTLELENLEALRKQKSLTPSPITGQGQNQPISPPSSQPPPWCAPCAKPSYNLAVEQGATLSTKITITITPSGGTPQPVDVTGYNFQFTAKTDPTLPDTDPSVVTVDWQETNTPTEGTTWLILPASVTANMQLVAYYYQVRMVSPSGIVTPLVSGTLTICQPISPRY